MKETVTERANGDIVFKASITLQDATQDHASVNFPCIESCGSKPLEEPELTPSHWKRLAALV
jgi:hypothetical protein